MPTFNWLKNAFADGYSSGDIASPLPNWRRWHEERRIGGSYRRVLAKGIYVPQNAVVLEIGHGRGSWTRALLKSIPTCVIVVDFHDVDQWLQPEKYDGRLKCHIISDNAGYSVFPDEYFDFCFSFGVLCHNNIDSIEEILRNVLPKMKLVVLCINMPIGKSWIPMGGGKAMYRPPSVTSRTRRSGGRAILGKGWEPLRRVPAGLSFRLILLEKMRTIP